MRSAGGDDRDLVFWSVLSPYGTTKVKYSVMLKIVLCAVGGVGAVQVVHSPISCVWGGGGSDSRRWLRT